jgi:dethiobiotin synthetase
MSVLIITGTGTGVGKTIATAALTACAQGSVAVVKPAQTGVAPGERGDLAEVTRLTGCTDTHEYARYPEPLAPHHAAARSGLPELALTDVAGRIGAVAAERDLVLVEGAGGLLVPFATSGWTLAGLAAALGAPVVLVTSAGLGTINHTTLTIRAMSATGLTLAGILIGSWPAHPGVAERCNLADLAAMSPDGELAGALPAGMPEMRDFGQQARAALSPHFGGVFDGAAFRAAVSPTGVPA